MEEEKNKMKFEFNIRTIAIIIMTLLLSLSATFSFLATNSLQSVNVELQSANLLISSNSLGILLKSTNTSHLFNMSTITPYLDHKEKIASYEVSQNYSFILLILGIIFFAIAIFPIVKNETKKTP